jgi:hypothetical protein
MSGVFKEQQGGQSDRVKTEMGQVEEGEDS